jgi:radical SAM protein with 4Fe4S-binding SPASM domain
MRRFGFQWHITDICNLRCAHCYQESFWQRPSGRGELASLAERIFSALEGTRVSVNVTGGEPLLEPHLFELLDRLHGFSSLDEVHLITNGTVASEAVVERIRSLPKVRSIKVSLEGASATVDDAIRGDGHFAAARSTIETLVSRSGKEVVLMITLARHNLAEIGGVVALARDLGAHGVIFERFVPLGRGRAVRQAVLGPEGWRAAVASIVAQAGIEADPLEMLPFRAFWLTLAPGGHDILEGALCNLGDESMALMPDGTVFPCRRLPIPVGNAAETPFAEILARLAHYRVSAIRERLHGGLCGMCGLADCAGCRAIAAALSHDPLADDPQCILQLE